MFWPAVTIGYKLHTYVGGTILNLYLIVPNKRPALVVLYHEGAWDTYCNHHIMSEVICDVLKEEWIESWPWRQKDSNISGHNIC